MHSFDATTGQHNKGKMPRVWLVAALAFGLISANAHGQPQDETEEGAQQAYELAYSLSQCVGYWSFYAEVEDTLGNAATAENARSIERGARLSAGYFLSLRHTLENPDQPPRTYGSWGNFIDALASITKTQMLSALEQSRVDEITEQARACVALGEVAQEVVDQMRRDTLSRQ